MVGARGGAGGSPGSPRREAPGSPGGSPLPSRKRKANAGPPQPRLTSFLPHWLVYATGMSEEEAARYAGHSARSGAGTAAAQSGLQPHQICHLAGVKDINWLVGYMRESIRDRLRASWAVGL